MNRMHSKRAKRPAMTSQELAARDRLIVIARYVSQSPDQATSRYSSDELEDAYQYVLNSIDRIERQLTSDRRSDEWRRNAKTALGYFIEQRQALKLALGIATPSEAWNGCDAIASPAMQTSLTWAVDLLDEARRLLCDFEGIEADEEIQRFLASAETCGREASPFTLPRITQGKGL